MILLITLSPRGQECATALEEGTGERVQWASSLRAASALVHTEEYTAVVLDQLILDADPRADLLLHHAGAAVPVCVNLAISSAERLVREVNLNLRRAQSVRAAAMRQARESLRAVLKGAVTGILLSSQLALETPELPDAAQVRLKLVQDLAEEMRKKLEA
jgi:hypothetical protein